MKNWRIPVYWEMAGVVNVEADTLDEAVDIVRKDEDDIPLPEGDYVDGSFEVTDYDVEMIRCLYNDNQEDENEE